MESATVVTKNPDNGLFSVRLSNGSFAVLVLQGEGTVKAGDRLEWLGRDGDVFDVINATQAHQIQRVHAKRFNCGEEEAALMVI